MRLVVPCLVAALAFGAAISAWPQSLNPEAVNVLTASEVKTRFAAQSALPGTSGQFGALIRQDAEKWAKGVKSANVKIDWYGNRPT